MSYYQLPKELYRDVEEAVVRAQFLPNVYQNVCTVAPMPFAYQSKFYTASAIDNETEKGWSEAPIPNRTGASTNFKETTNTVYRQARVLRFNASDLKRAAAGDPLDKITIDMTMETINKEIEAFVFDGAYINETRTSTGLFNQAGNTSTSDVDVGVTGTAGNWFEIVNYAKQLLIADGHGTGKLDLVVDTASTTVLADLFSLPATDAVFNEADRIKASLLNGGGIYLTAGLPAASNDDATAILVENKPTNYRLRTPDGMKLTSELVYDPITDQFLGRIEGFYVMEVYKPNAICAIDDLNHA